MCSSLWHPDKKALPTTVTLLRGVISSDLRPEQFDRKLPEIVVREDSGVRSRDLSAAHPDMNE